MGKILIIDDQKYKRDYLKEQLIELDHRPILESEDGEVGFTRAKKELPDLILLDIDMGEGKMTGYEFLDLKEDSKIRDIPVVIISKSVSEEKLIRSIERGAADYFQFPAPTTLLRARIDKLLELRKQQLAAAKHAERIGEALLELDDAKRRADALLKAVFPEQLLPELLNTKDINPKRIENVAVLFSDVVGFTAYSHDHSPEEVVEKLQELVTTFEDVAERNGIEKIKTIGDAFMAAGGLFDDDPDVAFRTVKCGMEMIAAAKELPMKWQVRIGIHSGPVVAGKIGKKKYSYDIWGDTVNTASRVEHQGIPGFVVVSRPVWEKIASRCRGLPSGLVEVKGKPDMELFKVERIVAPS